MKYSILFTALFCSVSSSFVVAETTLPEMVVTVTRSSQALSDSLSAVTVITQQEIKQSQAVDVPSLLRRVAGLELYQSGGLGSLSSVFMRGSNPNHTLVLLDGVRLNTATAGLAPIQDVMLDQVERIEILRGNASSLYGSEAIGGVIQIFTKSGQGAAKFSLAAGAGAEHTHRLASNLAGQHAQLRYQLGVSHVKSEGFSAGDQGLFASFNPDRDGYRNESLSGSLSYDFNPRHQISARLNYTQAELDTDSRFDPVDTQHQSEQELQTSAVTFNNQLADQWHSRLQLSHAKDRNLNYKNGQFRALFKTSADQLDWQNQIQLAEGSLLLLGFDHLTQQVGSSTAFTTQQRHNNALYMAYTGEYGANQLQLNLRHDRNSQFGSADTGLLAYGYQFNPAWRVRASYSTAFKAPTFNDLYYPFEDYGWGYSYVGNAQLRPERSRNRELGVSFNQGQQALELNYFHNQIRDLITGNNLPAATMINLNSAKISGWELVYRAQYQQTQVNAALTLQDPRNADSGEQLIRRAKQFANVSVDHQLGDWRLGGEWQHNGNRRDSNWPGTIALPAYDLFNLRASYAINKQLDVNARVDNVTDKAHNTAYGYNSSGRGLFLGVNYTH